MVVKTNSKRIKNAANNLQLLAANHFECWCCSRERNYEFLDLLKKIILLMIWAKIILINVKNKFLISLIQ